MTDVNETGTIAMNRIFAPDPEQPGIRAGCCGWLPQHRWPFDEAGIDLGLLLTAPGGRPRSARRTATMELTATTPVVAEPAWPPRRPRLPSVRRCRRGALARAPELCCRRGAAGRGVRALLAVGLLLSRPPSR